MTNAADHTDISQMSLDERFSIASKTDTAKELLSRLAEDEDYLVRMAVAKNPCAPETALRHLAEDEYLFVRCSVAQNPATPEDVLMLLAQEPEVDFEDVRAAVALNESAPLPLLELLAQDESSVVRGALTHNPCASEGVLRRACLNAWRKIRSPMCVKQPIRCS